jgi:hypothetical protein
MNAIPMSLLHAATFEFDASPQRSIWVLTKGFD